MTLLRFVSLVLVSSALKFTVDSDSTPTCKGTLTQTDVDCESQTKEECDNHYTASAPNGKTYVQCGWTGAQCLSSGPQCKEKTDPWKSLPTLDAAVEAKVSWVDTPGLKLKSVANTQGLAALGESKAMACGMNGHHPSWSNWMCLVLQVNADNSITRGEVFDTGLPKSLGSPYLEGISEDRALYCGKLGSFIKCQLLAAEGLKLKKVGDTFQVPHPDVRITLEVTVQKLQDGKALVCQNEDHGWAKDHHISCTVLTDKGDSLVAGPLHTLVRGMPNAYGKAAMARRDSSSLVMCHNMNQKDKNVTCGMVSVKGDEVGWAGATVDMDQGDGGGGMATVEVLTPDLAIYCWTRGNNKPCFHLAITATSISKVTGGEFTMPRKSGHNYWQDGRMARMWSDRFLYCFQNGRWDFWEWGNPLCMVVKTDGKTASLPEPTHPNGGNDKQPKATVPAVVTLAPGRAMMCAEDKDCHNPPMGGCAVFYLPN
ncbi:unnamed protein product [Symbiodinium necroappetens]|uniref:Uncharacterized protein n=1 Tax=Symbiodinium necroappetens TaxID=1628268 RepID=A0A813A1E2_9DINO|nr:unnamed protein product [Symbiodinium necroappetens]